MIWAQVLEVDRVECPRQLLRAGRTLAAGHAGARTGTDTLQVELPVRVLFEAPRIAELAEHITHLQRESRKGGTASGGAVSAPDRCLFPTHWSDCGSSNRLNLSTSL